MIAVDLFAGAGGWDCAARELGIDPIGIEMDDAACRTRLAAGFPTIQADLSEYEPRDFLRRQCKRPELLIASSPCPTFSRGGNKEGIADMAHINSAARAIAAGAAEPEVEWIDDRSALILEPLRWAFQLRPKYIAWEQVPDVLPFWTLCAQLLADRGYSVWTGVLHAERYGVPQTRERAILMAVRDSLDPVHPPMPTHQRYEKGVPAEEQHTLDGVILPWISMAEALGWSSNFEQEAQRGTGFVERGGERPNRRGDEPSFTIRAGGNGGGGKVLRWVFERPATTVSGDPRIAAPGHKKDRDYPDAPGRQEQSIRVTVEEAAALQAFPEGFPFQGGKTKAFQQVGNAVPPPLAKAILRELLRDTL